MYPYDSRIRWLLRGPSEHLLAALRRHPDVHTRPVIAARSRELQQWLAFRFVVGVLLYIGLIGTVVSWLSVYAPHLAAIADPATDAFGPITAVLGTSTGLLTLFYVFLTRIVYQIQMDIIVHCLLET